MTAPKRKAGRRPLGAAKMVRVAVTLDQATIDRAQAYGQGNISAAIRAMFGANLRPESGLDAAPQASPEPLPPETS